MLMGLLQPVTMVNHACVRFETNGVVVYVDPWHIGEAQGDADLIIITHAHGDHYAPGSIRKIMTDETIFCAGADVAAMLRETFALPDERVVVMQAGDEFEGPGDITVKAVPAENKNHPAGTGFGVVLGLDGRSYYLSGDTDTLDKDTLCDVLFCVCDGNFNMPDPVHRAPAEIQAMKKTPRLVVPYHYGNSKIPGVARQLADALNALGIEAVVLE